MKDKSITAKKYNMRSSSRTKLQVAAETPRKDEIGSLGATYNQVTLLQTDIQNDGNLLNCNRLSRDQRGAYLESFLESGKVTITMSVVTVYSLFSADVQELGFPKSADDVFSSLIVICLCLFSFELLLSFIYKPKYKWSFYFWLDLIATLSLITDIGWIWDSLIGVSNSSSGSKQAKSAGNASRAGTRTSRILRIIRLIRLIRIVKLYKNAQIANKKRNENGEEEFVQENLDPQSRVGKQLSEMNMKRVILVVLLLLFLLPFFDTNFYYTAQTSWDFGLRNLDGFIDTPQFEVVKNEYISYHVNDIRPIIYLSWSNFTGTFLWQQGISFNDLRYTEIYYTSNSDITSIFDIRYDARLSSLLNIMKTIFICVVLTLGSLYFSKDSEELVIKPIEKILDKVKQISNNPIAASDIKSEKLPENVSKKSCFCFTSIESANKSYEITVIENTVIKIGILLALGFGEAGSSIIGQNVEKGGGVDPMIAGDKVVGIFGFCDIRNFTDTTEELQEGVMVFVNEIAQVVHGVVDKYFGAANKNIGDAFLLVWKFSPDEFYVDEDLVMRNPKSRRAYYVPDMALMSFLKILAKVNKDPVLLRYRSNQKLLQRMPNYEVKMGFGMHLGWAIEGAIGSQFKVDASYLSPHVNIASALEGSTKIYGVPLLLSGAFYDSLSPSVQKYCRNIDVVHIKGSSKPIMLYTSDCDFSSFSTGKNLNRHKTFFRVKKIALKKKLEGGMESSTVFEESREIALMRKGFSLEFFGKFQDGVQRYVEGEWILAKEALEAALELRSKDGPSLSLLSYMSELAFKAPSNWDNARFLG